MQVCSISVAVSIGIVRLEPNVEEPPLVTCLVEHFSLKEGSSCNGKKVRSDVRQSRQDKHLLIDTMRSKLKSKEKVMSTCKPL